MVKLKDYNLVLSESGVYRIYSEFSDEVYVGSSVDMRRRAYSHFHSLEKGRHHSEELQDAFSKGDLFFEVLECCGQELLYERELHWVSHYDSIDNGYNTYTPADIKTRTYTKENIFSELDVEFLCLLLINYLEDTVNEATIYKSLCNLLGKEDSNEFKHKTLPIDLLRNLKPCWRYYCSLYMSSTISKYFYFEHVSNFDDFIDGKTISSLIRNLSKLKKSTESLESNVFSILDSVRDNMESLKDIKDELEKMLDKIIGTT